MHRNQFHGTPGEGPGRRSRGEGEGNMDGIDKNIERRDSSAGTEIRGAQLTGFGAMRPAAPVDDAHHKSRRDAVVRASRR